MKKTTRIILGAAAAYTAASMLLSGLLSAGIGKNAITTHRAPFALVEIDVSRVEGSEADGHIYGSNHLGEYIGFGMDAKAYPVGSTVVSVMLWNPLNNYCDDIIARYDFIQEPAR